MALEFNQVFDSLGWALVHSLWQGTLAMMAVMAFGSVFKYSAPSVRYVFQFICLLLCLIAFVVTFGLHHNLQSIPVESVPVLSQGYVSSTMTVEAAALAPDIVTSGFKLKSVVAKYTPLVGILWCLGFMFMAVRYATAYTMTQKLRRTGLTAVSTYWENRFRTLVLNTGLPQKVKFFISDYVSGPMTIGFLRPVVLVPASFFSGLPQEQIEAILLHELAHIRRHDYLFNLLQTVVKVIFFFHPAVHYISRQIDIQREQACDDLAIAQSKNPHALARGLAALRLQVAQPRFAMAAQRQDMPLVDRLKRLSGSTIKTRRTDNFLMPILTTILMGSVYLATTTVADAHPENSTSEVKDHKPDILDTRESGTYTFKTEKDGDRSVTLKIKEDGSRYSLIDGNWVNVTASPEVVKSLPTEMPQPAVPPQVLSSEVLAGAASTPQQMPKPPVPPMPNNMPTPPKPPVPPTVSRAEYLAGTDAPKWKKFALEMEKFETEMKRFEMEMDELEPDMKEFEAQMKLFETEMDRYISENPSMSEVEVDMMVKKAEKAAEKAIRKAELAMDKSISRAEKAAKLSNERMERHIEQQVEREVAQAEARLEREEERVERELERMEREQERREERIEREQERREEHMERLEEREAAFDRTHEAVDAATEIKHMAFKKKLLNYLIKDGIIKSRSENVDIFMRGGNMVANGVDIMSGFDGRYCELWSKFDLHKTPQSFIKIRPKSFEILDVSDDGKTRNHVTYGTWTGDENSNSKKTSVSKSKSQSFTSHTSITGQEDVLADSATKHASAGSMKFTSPLSTHRVTSAFGVKSNDGTQLHSGLDLAASKGTPVYASADGLVHVVTTEDKWGHRIIIKHADGFKSVYAHLNGFSVSRGQTVKAGQIIGTVGSTGKSSGPHLHFELRRNGHALDPAKFII